MASVADEIAALRGTRPATIGGLFKNRSFTRLWWAMLVSSLGDWVGFVAVTALVTRLGGARAGFAVSGVMIARLLPLVLFGPFAGVLVDRFDRKQLMVTADIARGIGYASMPFLGSLGAIYAVSFLIETFSLVWTPARDASIPNLVPRRQLANANSLALFTTYATLPLGGIVFTALVGLAAIIGTGVDFFDVRDEAVALWLDGLTFGFSAFMIWGLALRETRRRKVGFLRPQQAWKDLVEGVRFLRSQTFTRTMMVGILLAFLGVGSVIALGPIFARNTLDSPAGWGLLVTSIGVGMGAGMISVGWLTRFIEEDVLFPSAMVVGASTAVVLAAMPNIGLAALLTVVVGGATGVTWVTGYTLLQENVGDDLRGRVFGTLTVLGRLALLVSLAGFPLLVEAFGDHTVTVGGRTIDLAGTRSALWLAAAVVLLGGFLSRRGLTRSRLSRPKPLSLRPELRRFERRGTFIVFEGVEGAGKGTQIRLAREFLESHGYEVLATREPGGTDLGERLRETLLDRDSSMEARAEALLFAAGRAQHVASVIRPALEEGKVVLCDRYIDSSLVYQGIGRGLGEPDVLTLSVWATQGLFPDLVVLLDLDPDVGLSRVGGNLDRIESEGETLLAKVAEAYLHIAEEHPERVVVVDANPPPHLVHERVREALVRFLKIGDAEEEKEGKEG